VKQNQKK